MTTPAKRRRSLYQRLGICSRLSRELAEPDLLHVEMMTDRLFRHILEVTGHDPMPLPQPLIGPDRRR